MAKRDRRLPHNVPGDLFVDDSCIDCDTCRWMAQGTFVQRDGQASVARQPATERELQRALMALVSCPTASIGATEPHDMGPVRAALPDPVDEEVLHCGYHGEGSFGAASYLLLRPAGNVLVDSPRFTRPLVRRLEELGGVRWMFLTHRDDVLDHERFAAHFGCERVLHVGDRTRGTAGVERWIEGDDEVALAPDLTVVPTPGHTRGSACLLHADRHLFTGDHLAWSARLGHLIGFRSACWYDWDTLVRSTRRLAAKRFEWVLPGHGRRARIAPADLAAALARALAWMERAPTEGDPA